MSNKTDNDQTGRTLYLFGDYCLDLDRGTLSRDGEVVPLRPKAWLVLVYLVKHHGELVSRTDLIDAVWHNAAVSDDSLSQCIVEVRRAIGDAERTRLRTVLRRGFVLEMPVTERPADSQRDAEAKARRWFRPAWFAAASLLVIAATYLWAVRPAGNADLSVSGNALPAIAVLAFADMTAQQNQQYFADGVAEEILNHLARVPELRVISRSSSFSFRNEQPDIPAIAERLDVDFVLEGSVRGNDDRVRITAQLIEAETDSHIWSTVYDRAVSDVNVIDVQNDVAANVAAAIGRHTGTSITPPPKLLTAVSRAAQNSYLRGQYYFRRVTRGDALRQDYDNAVAHYRAAIAAEPDWALAHAALGAALHFYATGNYIEQDRIPGTFEQARARLEEAVRLDPGFGPAYASLAFIAHAHDLDFARAEALYAKAAELGTYAHWGYALLMRAQGRIEQSVTHYREALLIDPLSKSVTLQLVSALACAARYAEAAEGVDQLLEASPDDAGLEGWRAYLAMRLGDTVTARKLLERYHGTDSADNFAITYALLGMHDEARAVLEAVENDPGWHPDFHARLAISLGEEERVLDYLEAIADTRPRMLAFMYCPKELGPVAEHPRFQAVLARSGFPMTLAARYPAD